LAQRGCVVHALDICEAALNRVRNIVVKTWLPEQLADLPANTFDLAISNLVTQHMNDEDLVEQLCAVTRSLKPDGIFAMQFGYSLSGKYGFYTAIPTMLKSGGQFRSLLRVDSLVEKNHGRIVWANKIGAFPEHNCGWYGIHIVKSDESIPVPQSRSSENMSNTARSFNKEGEDFFGAGDADNAEAAFLRCLEFDPDFADAHNNLGVVYSQRSNHKLALKHFRKAVTLEPGNRLFVPNYDKALGFVGRTSEPSDLDSDFLKGHAGDGKRGEALSLRTEYLPFGKPNFSDEEIEAVSRTMRAGWVGMGQETIKFEEDLASYLDVPHVVTVNSCTSALFLSLLTHGIGPGDEVICPSLTWCSTANAALYLGAKPVFCDVDPDTLCVAAESISQKLTVRTRAVIVVHFGGLAADVERIRSILPPGVVIVEDAAHALGTKFPNTNAVATSGNLTCFSFYANKNLSTAEGGAIALFNDEQAEHLRSLRQHALASNAWNRFVQPKSMIYSTLTELGYKMNYTDLQAAIGRVQLKRQPEFHARRLEIANLYYQELSSLEPQIRFQHNVTHPYHARHLFTVVLPTDKMATTRDEFLLRLRSMNIGASIHYAPLHTMPLYAAAYPYELIHTERIGESILTLPISASMSLDDARYVTDKFIELFNASIEHEDQFCRTSDLHEESRVRDKVRLL
jgi:dTDP-4-amino-4,6-dideoxygalactose transaminase